VHDVDAGALLEELAREVPRAADARRRVVELAGLALGERHVIASVFAGSVGWTTITFGNITPMVIGAMSRFGS
jgi:hypothetical protein